MLRLVKACWVTTGLPGPACSALQSAEDFRLEGIGQVTNNCSLTVGSDNANV